LYALILLLKRIKSRAQVKAFDLLTLILVTEEYNLMIHLFMLIYPATN